MFSSHKSNRATQSHLNQTCISLKAVLLLIFIIHGHDTYISSLTLYRNHEFYNQKIAPQWNSTVSAAAGRLAYQPSSMGRGGFPFLPNSLPIQTNICDLSRLMSNVTGISIIS